MWPDVHEVTLCLRGCVLVGGVRGASRVILRGRQTEWFDIKPVFQMAAHTRWEASSAANGFVMENKGVKQNI